MYIFHVQENAEAQWGQVRMVYDGETFLRAEYFPQKTKKVYIFGFSTNFNPIIEN